VEAGIRGVFELDEWVLNFDIDRDIGLIGAKVIGTNPMTIGDVAADVGVGLEDLQDFVGFEGAAALFDETVVAGEGKDAIRVAAVNARKLFCGKGTC
jgi:hypothetical protein